MHLPDGKIKLLLSTQVVQVLLAESGFLLDNCQDPFKPIQMNPAIDEEC